MSRPHAKVWRVVVKLVMYSMMGSEIFVERVVASYAGDGLGGGGRGTA